MLRVLSLGTRVISRHRSPSPRRRVHRLIFSVSRQARQHTQSLKLDFLVRSRGDFGLFQGGCSAARGLYPTLCEPWRGDFGIFQGGPPPEDYTPRFVNHVRDAAAVLP